MAGLEWIAGTTAEIALSANTEKTVLQVVTPSANQLVKVLGWGVYFDGGVSTDEPVSVWVRFQASATGMTGFSLQKGNPSLAETIQSSGQRNATVEPTSSGVLYSRNVHPQSGYEYTAPYGREDYIPGGKALGIICRSCTALNVLPWFRCEE